jgi:hypothetical protein
MGNSRQSVISDNGKSVILPPYADNQAGWGNVGIPDLSVADSLQQYPIGTKYVEDGKVYRYCAFKATMATSLGAKNGNTQAVAYATVAASTDQYATRIVVDVGATDGRAGDGVIAADELAGGEILIFDATGYNFVITITSNTAVTTGGDEMTVDLLNPIPTALIADTDHVELMHNPYSYVNTTNERPVVGMPYLAYTTGQYGWVQTWGICWVAPQAAVGVGSNNLLCVFRHDGSIDELDYSDAYNSQGVIAGYVVCRTDATQAAPFIMLQLAP